MRHTQVEVFPRSFLEREVPSFSISREKSTVFCHSKRKLTAFFQLRDHHGCLGVRRVRHTQVEVFPRSFLEREVPSFSISREKSTVFCHSNRRLTVFFQPRDLHGCLVVGE